MTQAAAHAPTPTTNAAPTASLEFPAGTQVRHDGPMRPGGLSVPFKGKARRFACEQWIDKPRDEIFPFFADAHNLEAITPPLLKFNVLTPRPIDMKAGAIIDYKLKIRGFTAKWKTEITVWEPSVRFVDVQRKGPYSLWHHEHTFEDHDDRTRCVDVVYYAHAGGPIINKLLVAPDIEKIFAFRRQKLAEIFG